MPNASKVIVVDASVAASAGLTEMPTSKDSREFLLAMLHICHRLGMSDELAYEWRRHQSNFSMLWLGSMRRKRKVVEVDCAKAEAAWKEVAGDASFSEAECDAVRKDAHLVAAALMSDAIVASRDDRARALVGRLLDVCAGRRPKLHWVNPCEDANNVRSWLHRGAPDESGYRV